MLELAKGNQELFKTIGLIEALWPLTEDLHTKIVRIESLVSKNSEMLINASSKKDEDSKIDIMNFLTKDFEPAIEDLLKYINKHVKEDDRRGWQFWK